MLVAFFIVSLTSLPFLNYVNSWRFGSLSEAHAIATVRKEVAKEQDRKFLLVCSDSRSPKSLAFYFGYKYPRNLVVISAANLDPDRLLGSDKVFIFLDENRSRFLKSAYGLQHYDQQIRELDLQLLYQ